MRMDVEVDRAGQAYGAQDIGQDVQTGLPGFSINTGGRPEKLLHERTTMAGDRSWREPCAAPTITPSTERIVPSQPSEQPCKFASNIRFTASWPGVWPQCRRPSAHTTSRTSVV